MYTFGGDTVQTTAYGIVKFLCKGGMVPLSPGRKKKKKQLVLPSYDVIIGLYFTAESQNVSIDNTTPEFGDRGIWGRGGGGVRQES